MNRIDLKSNKKHSPIFFQFVLVALILFSVILFTSANFYESMIESYLSITLHRVLGTVSSFDISSEETMNDIHELEVKDSVLVEIYQKNENDSNRYSKTIYRQDSTYTFFDGDKKTSLTSPIIDFEYDDFINSGNGSVRQYNTDCKVGSYVNRNTQYSFFVMCSLNSDNGCLYVTGVRYSLIERLANVLNVIVIFVLMITFILMCLLAYLFFTRVTKPLREITNVTKAMAETNDKTLRIPKKHIYENSDTNQTINAINNLYESLIMTQESLQEKTEFLTTQIKDTDAEQKSREEFISGVSHELKTPIAIIQGYAEGAKFLKDDPEALEEYCDTIIDECIHMNDLVVNMIGLSKHTHTKIVYFNEFSIKDFIDERMRLNEKIFQKNDITAVNLITDDIIGKGDKEKLQFVINNLLSNAISYIGGERKIVIRYEDLGTTYRIYVYNTGNNIPQEELQKLWDSFYRQDPSRNRNEGHFGLGLTIVKSIQDAHSMSCGVDNADGGVEFWFDILK